MYKEYRYKRRKKKNTVVFFFTVLVLIAVAVVLKIGYGNLLGTPSAYTTLAYQPQNMVPKMDIKATQASLEDVLKQYQGLINSPNKMNKATLASEVDKLYTIAANANTNAKALAVTSNNEQVMDNLTQGSNNLAASLFELKDSLISDGDYSATQLNNSKEDLTLAIKNLGLVKQELKN